MDDEARRLARIVPTGGGSVGSRFEPGAGQADNGIKETGLETSGVFANKLISMGQHQITLQA